MGWLARAGIGAIAVGTALSASACCCCFDAVSNFTRYQCRAKQSEAKGNLKALFVAEESYRAEKNTYGTLDEVGFRPSGEKLRYDYVLVSHDAEHFVAEARGKDEMNGDLWRVDEHGQPENLATVEDCGEVQKAPQQPAPSTTPSDDGTLQARAY